MSFLELRRDKNGMYRTEGSFNQMRIRHRLGTKDRKVAKQRLGEYELAILNGHVNLSSKLKGSASQTTFSTVAKKYLRSRSTGGAKTTQQFVSRFIDEFGDMPIRSLTVEAIEDYIADYHIARGHTDGTIRRTLTALQSIINFGAKLGHCDYIKLDKPADNPHNTDTLTEEQIDKIFDVLHPDVRRFATFLRFTGARPIEAINLQFTDIDWQRDLVTLHSKKGRGGGTRSRTIPLHPEAKKVIPWSEPPQQTNVFTVNGRPIYDSNQLSKFWSKAREQTDIPDHIGMYALRHTFATNLCRKNVPVKVVADLLGHTDLKMVVRYMNTTLDDHIKAVAVL